MKALLRIFFVFLGLLTILVLSTYYVVSLPKFQKKLIEDLLPEGSSIHAVQITKESIELTGYEDNHVLFVARRIE